MATFGRWVLPPALLGLVFVALGCTSLLGIDGNYVNAQSEAGGAAGLGGLSGGAGDVSGSGGDTQKGDGGRSNAGGETESGGADPGGAGGAGGLLQAGGSTGAGDTPGSGGSSGSGGTGGTGGGNGGGTSVLPCAAGVYVGTYTGTHRTSNAGTFVYVPVGGPVAVQVTNADGGMPKMAFTFSRPTTLPNDGLDAKATVAFDCSKNSGSGPFQSDATFTTTFIPGHGLITGDVQVSSRTETTLKGTWSEHENAVPDFAKGSGTWEATLR